MPTLTRRSLLLSGAAATVLPRGAVAAAQAGSPDFLVVLFANGGWDVTFAMDPKPEGGPVEGPWVDRTDHPEDIEEVRVLNGIPVQCNDHKRLSVTRFFETWGSRACVVNGVWTGSIVHQPSRIRMLTGTQHPDRPDFATLVGAAKGVSVDLPLGTIDFSGIGYAGPHAATTGRIGYSSQLKALLSDETTFSAPSWADYTLPLFSPTTDEEAAVREHLARRLSAYGAANADGAHNDRLVADIRESWGRRQRLLDKADVIAGRLSLGGQPSLDLQVDVAVDLLAGGVCHTVTLADSVEGWDTHDHNALQHGQFQAFFTSLNRLCDGLERNGLLDRTLVVVASEMTRTPRRNYKTGKDHWSHTSQIWIGAGVSGGRVVGVTNASVESMPIDLASGEVDPNGALNKYDNVVAGILEHMGVDPGPHLPGVVPFRAPGGRSGR